MLRINFVLQPTKKTGDIHFPTLTVGETVHFAATLLMPLYLDAEAVKLREDIVLQLLGLSHVTDTIIGNELLRGVSGGEKRRVSIAVEWVKGL